jgi:hypothetical protein
MICAVHICSLSGLFFQPKVTEVKDLEITEISVLKNRPGSEDPGFRDPGFRDPGFESIIFHLKLKMKLFLYFKNE